MLMLPEWINEEISPDYSKSDIQAIRAEVAEEEKTTDLEILMEEREDIYDRLENDLQRVLWKLGQDIPELYCKLWKEYMRADNVEQLAKEVMEIMAPAGEGMHSARISGIGRLMLSLKGADRDLVLINVRSGEKQRYGWATRGAEAELRNLERTGEKGTPPHRAAAGGRGLYLSDGNEHDDRHPERAAFFDPTHS